MSEEKRLDDMLAGAEFLEAQNDVYRAGLAELLKWSGQNHNQPPSFVEPLNFQGCETDRRWAYEVERRVTAIIVAAAKVPSLAFS